MKSTRCRFGIRGIQCTLMLAALCVITAGSVMAQEFDHTHASFDGILKVQVLDGAVDYAALKAAPQALDQYLDMLAAVPEAQFKTWTEARQIAFLANLYNASTLRLILDHYPLKSIKKIGSIFKGPWDQPAVRLFGKTITLNHLEHGILRKDYHEPRLHMALVCAAKGCPPLRREAYTGERLNEQLNDQSRTYLASPAGLVINRDKGVASISSIFKWYGDDFPSVPAFIEAQSGHSLDGLKTRYLKYDWSLNGQ